MSNLLLVEISFLTDKLTCILCIRIVAEESTRGLLSNVSKSTD